MKIGIMESGKYEGLQPVTCSRRLLDCPLGGTKYEKALLRKLEKNLGKAANPRLMFTIADTFWPSTEILRTIASSRRELIISDPSNGKCIAFLSFGGTLPEKAKTIPADSKSVIVKYSWHLLRINEEIIGAMVKSAVKGEVREGAVLDGNVVVGKGTVILPGVYVEGNAAIGENCKIGPNCYIRGDTHIGNNCHIGQAVEIKNSILMDKVSAGHLSYIGDSIIGAGTNLGAGTITANLRHDGKNNLSMAGNVLVDTGRRKFGMVTGDNVHTGIHTSIYPGRKIWPGLSTRPGEIVSRDIMPQQT